MRLFRPRDPEKARDSVAPSQGPPTEAFSPTDAAAAQERSVHHLQEPYTVAVAAALAFAAGRVITVKGDSASFNVHATGPTIAFLATLIPFYHGAVRHLDRVYIQERGHNVRRGALLADFIMLFAEGFQFAVIAQLLTEPQATAWGLIALLGFDALWGMAVYFLFARVRQPVTERRWTIINVAAASILSGLAVLPWDAVTLPIVFAGVVIRSMADYAWSWEFYFPGT